MKTKHFLVLLLIYNIAFAQPSNKNWQLKWEDNFDYFNDTIWWIKGDFDHSGSQTVHIASNVYVNDGVLVLRAKTESYCCPKNHVNSWWCQRQEKTGECYQYTGSWIETQSPEYDTPSGYIEARVKMTYRAGVGYAFWTFVGNQPHSNPSEMDIFETMVPGMKQVKNKISTNTHTCYKSETYQSPIANPDCRKPGNRKTCSRSKFNYTDWHTYAIEWDADKITWYVDGKAIRKRKNRNLDTFGNSIVDPVRIILGANVNPARLLNNSDFEEFMYVDYVKVYELKTP